MTRFFALAVLAGVVPAKGGLIAYDDRIASDNGSGLPYIAVSTTPFMFDTSNNEPFDFGATSGSVTAEFIVKGDPELGGRNGFLAVGANTGFSLRYEQWDNTGVLGFTASGVADYVFTGNDAPPGDPLTMSPEDPTHVTYRWDHTTSVMELFINGALTGRTQASGFAFPSGQGLLGNTPDLGQGMLGTIERVAVYDEALAPEVIESHSSAWMGPAGSLANYDAAIEDDNTNSVAVYTAFNTTPLTFDTTNSAPFDFGSVSDSATAEFIVEGDPVGGGQNGYLGVGADPTFSLRFEQWNDTGELGFTHGGVADYVFGPLDQGEGGNPLESPTEFTHVVYRFDADLGRMELFIDGVLAGFNDGASGFEMPTGAGLLGNNGGLTEGMLGEIARVTIYDDAIAPEVITAHANAWLGSDDLRPFEITDVDYVVNGDNVNVNLVWNSRPDTDYLVETSLDLMNWQELADSHPSEGETTSFTHVFSTDSAALQRYYRVSVAP